ncbi:hypothetical protein [Endozoicomonas sp. SCSIO W0465]|uniref:hypothetical protein n=1 Tax=Endozoicomonas sp. SCSIO W0465 TaxID=2918516 RepID=UPI0020753F5D|nr:hypothetical protein [Endozoicomonas sp. SCSIO W0465]USE37310.1 hypothetical protein MJO57_03525 [Endozoicomonas sp. SCSIO W0465]
MNLNQVSHTPAAWQSTAPGCSEQDTKKFVQVEADKLFVHLQNSGWGSPHIEALGRSLTERATQCAPFPAESIPDSTYRKAIDYFKNKLGYHDEEELLINAAKIRLSKQISSESYSEENLRLAECFTKTEMEYIARKNLHSGDIAGIENDHALTIRDGAEYIYGLYVLQKIHSVRYDDYLATFLNKLNPSLKFPDASLFP